MHTVVCILVRTVYSEETIHSAEKNDTLYERAAFSTEMKQKELLHLKENKQPFHMMYHFFCTIAGFFIILEKRLSELICTRL